jgi:hypothetical protein
LLFSSQILFLTRANHGKRDERRKEQRFFHIRRSSVIRSKKREEQWLVNRNLTLEANPVFVQSGGAGSCYKASKTCFTKL